MKDVVYSRDYWFGRKPTEARPFNDRGLCAAFVTGSIIPMFDPKELVHTHKIGAWIRITTVAGLILAMVVSISWMIGGGR